VRRNATAADEVCVLPYSAVFNAAFNSNPWRNRAPGYEYHCQQNYIFSIVHPVRSQHLGKQRRRHGTANLPRFQLTGRNLPRTMVQLSGGTRRRRTPARGPLRSSVPVGTCVDAFIDMDTAILDVPRKICRFE
jgi:hypothetical protein